MSVIITADDLLVCTDCAVLSANGEGTEEHAAAMVAHLGEDAPHLVITCDGDGAYAEDPTTARLHRDFSSHPCDGCGTTDAGSRCPAAILKPARCVYTDAEHHSTDLLQVHHGRPEPTIICGYHEQALGLPTPKENA
jgi:hypothetical protein